MPDKKLNQYHHGDLRAAVLAQAFETVKQEGAESLSLRAIARELNVDAAAVYRHFRAKKSILAELKLTALQDLSKTLHKAQRKPDNQSAVDEMVAIGVAYIKYAINNPRLFEFIFTSTTVENLGNTATLADPLQSPKALFQSVCQQLEESPGFHSASRHEAEFILWSAVHGAASLFITESGSIPNRQKLALATSVCENVVSGLIVISDP